MTRSLRKMTKSPQEGSLIYTNDVCRIKCILEASGRQGGKRHTTTAHMKRQGHLCGRRIPMTLFPTCLLHEAVLKEFKWKSMFPPKYFLKHTNGAPEGHFRYSKDEVGPALTSQLAFACGPLINGVPGEGGRVGGEKKGWGGAENQKASPGHPAPHSCHLLAPSMFCSCNDSSVRCRCGALVQPLSIQGPVSAHPGVIYREELHRLKKAVSCSYFTFKMGSIELILGGTDRNFKACSSLLMLALSWGTHN